MARFWSSQTCVMPTFSPTIALVVIGPFTRRLRTGGPRRSAVSCAAVYRNRRPRTSVRIRQAAEPGKYSPHPFWARKWLLGQPAPKPIGLGGLDLDLDVDAGGQLEALEGVDGLGTGLEDVEQALVDPHLEVLPRV